MDPDQLLKYYRMFSLLILVGIIGGFVIWMISPYLGYGVMLVLIVVAYLYLRPVIKNIQANRSNR